MLPPKRHAAALSASCRIIPGRAAPVTTHVIGVKLNLGMCHIEKEWREGEGRRGGVRVDVVYYVVVIVVFIPWFTLL